LRLEAKSGSGVRGETYFAPTKNNTGIKQRGI
ncbi:hypothetical protein AM305_04648, partial [Actinobacillus minor NM305]